MRCRSGGLRLGQILVLDKLQRGMVVAMPLSESGIVHGLQRCFVATGSRAPATSAMMLAGVTAGVPSAAVRMPSAEILPAAVEALRRMAAASHVETA